jgi:hypothetical protein
MGNFYVNHVVLSESASEVANCLRSQQRKGFVAKPAGGMMFFFDEESDTQDDEAIRAVGAAVSRSLMSPVFAVLNHDDDILCYWLFESGNLVDEYNSCPGYFSDGDTTPSGGDARKLSRAFGVLESADEIERILRSEDYLFALDRHESLAKVLSFPWPLACTGYGHIERQELSDHESAQDFTRVD